MKKIAMTIIVAITILAIGCAKQKENTQTNDLQPGLIKGRVGKSIQIRPLQIIF
jgi:hypothetical protein